MSSLGLRVRTVFDLEPCVAVVFINPQPAFRHNSFQIRGANLFEHPLALAFDVLRVQSAFTMARLSPPPPRVEYRKRVSLRASSSLKKTVGQLTGSWEERSHELKVPVTIDTTARPNAVGAHMSDQEKCPIYPSMLKAIGFAARRVEDFAVAYALESGAHQADSQHVAGRI